MNMQAQDELIEHDLIQGSDEWLSFRMNHDGASETAAMLGLSKKTSRTELLRMKSSGICKEFSDWVQKNILDYGHEVEAMARPIVAKQYGIRLFPVTFSRGRLSASTDGVTMDTRTLWESKQWNESLAESVAAQELPDEFMAQPQQQLMVTSAERCIFTVSDGTEQNMVSMEILPDPVWFERIRTGWEQFNKDRENYIHVEVQEMPKAEAMIALPTLFIQAKGEITPESSQNLVKFSEKTAQYLADRKADLQHLRTSPDVTDQDVSNAKARGADCREAVKRLALVQDGVLAQTMTLGEAMATIDKLKEDYRLVALDLEKEADKAIDAKKFAILSKAKIAYVEHIAALEIETKPIRISVTPPDFALATKGKKSIKGWQDAVDTALANGKIAADFEAKDIRAKLAWCKETSAGYGFLFNDLAQIIRKPMDDFQLTVTTRINQHKIDEAAKEEATRQRIRAEEEAKAIAKAKAESDAAIDAMVAKKRAEIEAEQATIKAVALSGGTNEEIIQSVATEKPVDKSAEIVHIGQSAKRPSDTDIIRAIIKEFGCTNGQACDWIIEMADNMKQAA